MTVLLSLLATASAVPMELTHQGRMLDATSGLPLAGSQDVTFELFANQTGGSALWSETQNLPFDQGYFTARLGSQTTLDDSVLDGSTVWLALSVNGGAAIGDRIAVVSVPYAVRAGAAGSVQGGVVDASEIQIDGSTVIDGSGTLVAAEGTLSGLTCNPGEIAIYDGSDWDCGGVSGDWSTLSGIPLDFADNDDADTLADLGVCSDGSVPRFDVSSTSWGCGGDLTLTEPQVEAFVTNGALDLSPLTTMGGSAVVTVATNTPPWSSLTGVPPGFADGTDDDTVLDEAAVDAYVANNGYALTSDLAAIGLSGDWSDLINVPADLADGDADDWSEIANIPADIADGDADDWSEIANIPAGFADGVDNDGLGAITCTDSQVLHWSDTSGGWVCTSDIDITSATLGSATINGDLTVTGDVSVTGTLAESKPYVVASGSTGSWISCSGGHQYIQFPFNSIQSGNSGSWFNPGNNNEFTAPVDGLYMFAVHQYSHPNTGSTGYWHLGWSCNGEGANGWCNGKIVHGNWHTLQRYPRQNEAAGDAVSETSPMFVHLSAGETIRPKAYCNGSLDNFYLPGWWQYTAMLMVAD